MSTDPKLQAITETLRLWLNQGPHKNSSDPIAGALQIGLEARDLNIDAMSRDARAYLKLKETDDSDSALRLRAMFGHGRLTDMNDDPQVEALRCFTERGTHAAHLLDQMVVECLTMEPHMLRLADRFRSRPPASNTMPPPARATRSTRSTKPKPMTAKLLQNAVTELEARITTNINRAVRVETDQPNRKPPDPLTAADGVQPPIQFDPATLQDTGCPDLLLLQTGPEGEAHLAKFAQQVIAKHLPAAAAREAIQKTRLAERCQNLLSEYNGWEPPPEDPLSTFPEKPLRALWELHQPGTPMGSLWLLLARGPAGRGARAKAAQEALDHLRQKENQLEQVTMELTPYEQAERRANYSYQGPTLGWHLETLQALWDHHHPHEPMPRRWRQLAPGTPIEAANAVRNEMFHLDLYERALTLLQEAVDLPQSVSTIRKKHQAAQEALNRLYTLRSEARDALLAADISPPPPDDHSPLPQLETSGSRRKITPQQTFALPSVAVVPTRPRPTPRPQPVPAPAATPMLLPT